MRQLPDCLVRRPSLTPAGFVGHDRTHVRPSPPRRSRRVTGRHRHPCARHRRRRSHAREHGRDPRHPSPVHRHRRHGPGLRGLGSCATSTRTSSIVDPRLPEVSDGMALIRRLRAMDPSVRDPRGRLVARPGAPALDAGADGFVRKTFKPGDLSARSVGAWTAGSEADESVRPRCRRASPRRLPDPVPCAERA